MSAFLICEVIALAKVYLKGSDVENDSARQRARLLGICHETYVYNCATKGNTYNLNNATKYCFPIKEKMEEILDGDGNPVLDELGNKTYQGTGEYALEMDNDSETALGEYYDSLYSTHVSRVKTRTAMETAGWFVNE